MSPAAASAVIPARASGPSSPASSCSVSGPREVLTPTWCPAATASPATVPPIIPLPMNPTVVMQAATPGRRQSFRLGPGAGFDAGASLPSGWRRHRPDMLGADHTIVSMGVLGMEDTVVGAGVLGRPGLSGEGRPRILHYHWRGL